MITLKSIREYPSPGAMGDSGLGNKLFQIAGTIGIAIENGLDYGFEPWESQHYFVYTLPRVKMGDYPIKELGWDYCKVKVEDNTAIQGYMQDYRYWKHCEDIIRNYFKMDRLADPLKKTVGIHFRAYGNSEIHPEMKWEYYERALMCVDKKLTKVVFTDDIERAKKVIKMDCEFRSSIPIIDFYHLTTCEAVICSNSTFPWWAGWIGKGKVVIPSQWFGGRKSHLSTSGFNHPSFTKI